MKNTLCIPILYIAITLACLGNSFAQAYDISSGGTPTITGSLNGSVGGASGTQSDLTVTVNFGELSPMNSSAIVLVTVPIGIRSTRPYRVMAQVTGIVNANVQAMHLSDIGFGIGNLRRSGNRARICNNSDHIIYSPFGNNPSGSVFLNANGRAAYPASLTNLTTAATIMSGPRLSQGRANRRPNNAWLFDATFAIVPQFYASGSSSATITFTISAGPNVPC